MAIRNVNGRNVYILEPREPTGKTTTGKNWATLYTDLRWKLWEEVQKNEAAALKMEMASAKVRKDYYDDKIKVLQDQRKQLQSAALKVERGNTGSANRDYFSGARILQKDKEATSKLTKTKIIPEREIFGKTIPESREVTEIAREGGGLPADIREGIQRRMLAIEQELEAPPAEGEAPAPVGPTIDQQIEALDRDLEQLLLQRQAAGGGLDADLLGRTRESFASQVGVIGQGGGPFGLAPRRRRTMPYVQEDLAQERIDQFLQDREQFIDRAVSANEEKRQEVDRLRGLAAELETIGLGGEGGEADMLYREAAQLESTLITPEEAERQADKLIRRRIESDERFTPRAPGELLRRDIRRDYVDVPAVARAGQRLREAEQALQPLEEPVPSFESFPMEAGRAKSGIGQQPITAVPAAPVTPAPTTTPAVAPEDEIVFKTGEVTVEPAPSDEEIVFGPGEVTVEPQIKEGQSNLGGGYVFDGQSGIIFGPTGFPVFATFPQQVPAGQEEPKVVSEVALRGIAQRIRETGGDISAVSGYQSREAKPEDFELEEEEFPMEPAGPPQGSSRQRKDKYKFDVVSEGTKLARTPKKLQRLAKTNLPEENRPAHYVIVDKLYDVNRGKEQAFKMTYDEISRAFQNDPQKRSDAHKYLVAKDILESDVSEPLA